MTSMFQSFWTGAVRPLLSRPPALQVAALCYRDSANGIEVLLVTSSSGRWILPKGWPIDGLTAAQAARQEAWEEAGVKAGELSEAAFDSYLTDKKFDNGAVVPCEVQVFPLRVLEMSDTFPEKDRRERLWVPIADATQMIDEEDLQQLLVQFAANAS